MVKLTKIEQTEIHALNFNDFRVFEVYINNFSIGNLKYLTSPSQYDINIIINQIKQMASNQNKKIIYIAELINTQNKIEKKVLYVK